MIEVGGTPGRRAGVRRVPGATGNRAHRASRLRPAFGEVISETGTWPAEVPFGYQTNWLAPPGLTLPDGTQLYLTKTRVYDPREGRFLQRDQLLRPGENAYVYVSANPVEAVDVEGRQGPAPEDGVCEPEVDPEDLSVEELIALAKKIRNALKGLVKGSEQYYAAVGKLKEIRGVVIEKGHAFVKALHKAGGRDARKDWRNFKSMFEAYDAGKVDGEAWRRKGKAPRRKGLKDPVAGYMMALGDFYERLYVAADVAEKKLFLVELAKGIRSDIEDGKVKPWLGWDPIKKTYDDPEGMGKAYAGLGYTDVYMVRPFGDKPADSPMAVIERLSLYVHEKEHSSHLPVFNIGPNRYVSEAKALEAEMTLVQRVIEASMRWLDFPAAKPRERLAEVTRWQEAAAAAKAGIETNWEQLEKLGWLRTVFGYLPTRSP